jgi:histidinol dehydrogenase
VLLARPASLRSDALQKRVAVILKRVQSEGDIAVRAYAQEFDGVTLKTLAVSAREFAAAEKAVDPMVKAAMRDAAERIRRWHKAGMVREFSIKTAPGVHCGRILRPIQRVGLYIPAGSAPLPSSVLMLGIPAQLAGCPEVVLCSPAQADGRIDPSILVAARICGITRVFKTGGAQAIAAMAFGTRSIPRCDKLFGPGNAYVATAKQQVQALPGGPAIDMPAGPSEVLVIADASAHPAFVAADLLAQAEHGPDSQVLCLSDDAGLLDRIQKELDTQLAALSRRAIAGKALQHARLIRTQNLTEAFAISNRYAPEHLILALADAESHLDQVHTAGSVFLGHWASEALGDYCSGTNHTLPTDGAARAYSGVSVASFQLAISTQRVSRKGLLAIGACAETLATCEGLDAHAAAVRIRRQAVA